MGSRGLAYLASDDVVVRIGSSGGVGVGHAVGIAACHAAVSIRSKAASGHDPVRLLVGELSSLDMYCGAQVQADSENHEQLPY